ncbi:MAG: porin family protein [Acidobacteria bacterium]|nr:porin family protein [Acidobacteriota bacterium]
MRRKMLFTIAVTIFFLSLNNGRAHAQADESLKVEVGGQVSVLNASNGRASVTTTVQCIIPPCPVVTHTSEGAKTEPGFGGRVGYNLTQNVALEAEGNFFPREREFGGGRKSQALFGIKAGKRFEQVGLFVKARPGLVHFSEGDLREPRDFACITIFPPPRGCFEAKGRTDFAFDVGGVFEYYPSRRTLIRFDAGDTIIRMGEHRVPIVINSDPATGAPVRVGVVTAPSETTHNFQGSIGFGFRF